MLFQLPCAQRLSHHLLLVTEALLTEAPAGSQQGNLLLYQLAYVRLLGAMHATYVADKGSIKAKLKVGPCTQLLSPCRSCTVACCCCILEKEWPGLFHRPAACSFNPGTARELNCPALYTGFQHAASDHMQLTASQGSPCAQACSVQFQT